MKNRETKRYFYGSLRWSFSLKPESYFIYNNPSISEPEKRKPDILNSPAAY